MENELGGRLRKLRESRGMSAAELSEACGLGNTAVWDIETGKSQSPKVQTMQVICQVLGCSFTDLVREEGRSKKRQFIVSHADSSPFEKQGLRAFFETRQLGLGDATNGDFGAQVIRAVPGEEGPGKWHSHDLDFQMIYVTKGWVVFEYAGEGEQVLRAGSSVLQPSGIVHREVRHSDDMELLEVTCPARFETNQEDAPAS